MLLPSLLVGSWLMDVGFGDGLVIVTLFVSLLLLISAGSIFHNKKLAHYCNWSFYSLCKSIRSEFLAIYSWYHNPDIKYMFRDQYLHFLFSALNDPCVRPRYPISSLWLHTMTSNLMCYMRFRPSKISFSLWEAPLENRKIASPKYSLTFYLV